MPSCWWFNVYCQIMLRFDKLSQTNCRSEGEEFLVRLWVAGQWACEPHWEILSFLAINADRRTRNPIKDWKSSEKILWLTSSFSSTWFPSGCWASQLAWRRASRETPVCPGRGYLSSTVGKKRPRKWRNQICLIRSFIRYLQNDDLAYCLAFPPSLGS